MMCSAKEIGVMRAELSTLAKEHPEFDDFVEGANQELWAIELMLEMDEKDDEEEVEEDEE
jgi:hypothetical protein